MIVFIGFIGALIYFFLIPIATHSSADTLYGRGTAWRKESDLALDRRARVAVRPVPAMERAKRLIPNIQAELIPRAGHELPGGKPETIFQKDETQRKRQMSRY